MPALHSIIRVRLPFAPALLAVLAGVAGCSSAPQPQAVDPAPLRAFAARGYTPAEHGAVSRSVHRLPLAGQVQTLVLLRPAQPAAGGTPLLVYLPGLGESAEAGAVWREAWAEAGYAVLSLQALPEDATAWQSDLARDGAFRLLGQRHYAGAAMARRVQALAGVLAEAQRRGAAGEADWQGLAWQRLAVAGFDLGAYTAMVLAGEQVRGTEGSAGRLPVRAVIALSPYANVSEGGLNTRYQAIQGPVLSITSDNDGDPLGLVAGAAQRLAPFEHTAGPDKYLLSLQGLAHARLSGSTPDGAVAERPAGGRNKAAVDAEGSSPGSDDGAQRGRSRGSSPDSGARRRGGSSTMGAGAESASGRGGASTSPAASGGLTATAVQLRLLAAVGVSTAFLDAYLRDDPLARDWLQTHTARWLGPAGELRQK